jgi:hypothetical protein
MAEEKKKNEAVELTDDDLEQVDGGYVPFGIQSSDDLIETVEEEETFQSSKKTKRRFS